MRHFSDPHIRRRLAVGLAGAAIMLVGLPVASASAARSADETSSVIALSSSQSATLQQAIYLENSISAEETQAQSEITSDGQTILSLAKGMEWQGPFGQHSVWGLGQLTALNQQVSAYITTTAGVAADDEQALSRALTSVSNLPDPGLVQDQDSAAASLESALTTQAQGLQNQINALVAQLNTTGGNVYIDFWIPTDATTLYNLEQQEDNEYAQQTTEVEQDEFVAANTLQIMR